MDKPITLPGIRNITVSGRIGSGASTLAEKLGEELGWEVLEGGRLFRKFALEKNISITQTNQRPDRMDLEYEAMVTAMLRKQSGKIIQSHLAGFDAQGIEGVFKILVLCEDDQGNDRIELRIDRLVNRENVSIEEAKQEVKERERQNLEKWQKLYAEGELAWVYWDKKYYDLVINTYSHNKKETLRLALSALKASF